MREALQERGTALLERSAKRCSERGVRADTALRDRHRRQRDLRAGPHRRPGRRRPSRRQRAVLDRAARRHDGERDPQVPEAGAGLADRLHGDHAPAARLRRQPARRGGDARGGRALRARSACRSPCCTSASDDGGRATGCSTRRAAISQPVRGPSHVLQQTGDAHERIVEFMRDGGYDLLFIGAYGHSRIIEMVLGSTTEYVLRNATVARLPRRADRSRVARPAAWADRSAGRGAVARRTGVVRVVFGCCCEAARYAPRACAACVPRGVSSRCRTGLAATRST